MKKIIILLTTAILLTGCDDLFTPAIDNNKTIDSTESEPSFAQGVLANAYTYAPYNSQTFNDVATDDAVSNQSSNGYSKMATGTWTASSNPMDQWSSCNMAIQYINIFLEIVDNVTWADDETVNALFCDRLKGEVYGLRAMFMFYLLQAHGGWTTDGQLLGVPIVLESQNVNDDFNRPRNTFDDCVKQIYADVEQAEMLLPLTYKDITSESEMPVRYRTAGVSVSEYIRVFGQRFRSRMSGHIAKAFRAKAALLAASPVFAEGTSVTWEDAANHNAELLDLIGGISGIDAKGFTWYTNASEIAALGAGECPKEILWRYSLEVNVYGLEQTHFPSSLYGSGQLNPTHNLVNAFPMANGYPITDGGSGYNKSNPYENRDPRLSAYIIVNGSKAGLNGDVINTSVDGTNNDALNQEDGVSTRTGYYMRKHLREDVSLSSTSRNGQTHYNPRIRYTELYLNYAEAANEAWGPDGKGTHSYSAYDVIKEIRKRAGVGTDNGDAYLESIKNDKEKMQKMIRNERRLELCFEGFRFWDLRRWNSNMTEAATGIRIQNNTYTEFTVENRRYSDYMNYGPIPYVEILKFDALIQNKGW